MNRFEAPVPVVASSQNGTTLILHAGLPSSYYPVTKAIVWILHVVFVFQCTTSQRRRRRDRQSLSYSSLVRRKQFYRWWRALSSLYHSPPPSSAAADVVEPTNDTLRPHSSRLWWSRLATFHGPDNHPLTQRISRNAARVWQEVVGLTNGSTTTTFVLRGIVASLRRLFDILGMSRVYARIGGRSFLALWVHTHVIWSCRALEQHYYISTQHQQQQQHSNAWSYWFVLLSIAIWSTVLEGGVVYYTRRIISRMARDQQPPSWPVTSSTAGSSSLLVSTMDHDDHDASLLDPATARRLCAALQHSHMAAASPTTISAALLMIFRFQFPRVAIPWLPDLPPLVASRWIGPNFSHALTLAMLYVTSTRDDANATVVLRSIMIGSAVGLLWEDWLDFGATTYWGNGLLFGTLILTIVSLKAQHPHAFYLAWLDHVAYHARSGRALVYDGQSNQWLLPVLKDSVHIFGFDDYDDDKTDPLDESDDVEDDRNSSRGVHRYDTSIINDMDITELTSLSTTSPMHRVRARRGVATS